MSDILKNYPLDKVRIRNINKIKMEHPVSFEYIKKQGALEELRKEKRLLKKIINLDLNDNENNVSPEICKLIEDELKRIKELEKEGVEQK
jgi:hypothetical protein